MAFPWSLMGPQVVIIQWCGIQGIFLSERFITRRLVHQGRLVGSRTPRKQLRCSGGAGCRPSAPHKLESSNEEHPGWEGRAERGGGVWEVGSIDKDLSQHSRVVCCLGSFRNQSCRPTHPPTHPHTHPPTPLALFWSSWSLPPPHWV